MKYLTLIRANIKRQKGSFIGVFVLMFIITVSLCTVLTIWGNSKTYVSEEMDRVGFGDVTSWCRTTGDTENLKEQITALEEVEKVETNHFISASCYAGSTQTGWGCEISAYRKEDGYYIFKDDLSGKVSEPEELKEGETYISPSLKALYNLEIGDRVEIQITDREDVYSVKVVGFFEDPVMGSSLVGMKQIFVSDKDVQNIKARIEEAGEQANCAWNIAYHVHKAEGVKETEYPLQRLLNENTDLKNYALYTYSKSAMMGFMLLLQDIFSALLLVFVLVLLVVAVLVISHSIVSGIEQDYTNMGILKAVGFTKADLQVIKVLQYVLAMISGMVLGVPTSVPVIQLVNKMIVPATGLMVPSKPPFGLCAMTFLGIFLFLFAVIVRKTARVGKISPVRAIRGGAEDVYFKSRFTVPIGKKGLSICLACRQFISGKKQYISAGLVSCLLVFFLTFVGRIDAWMGPDGDGLMDSFEVAPYDIGVWCEESMQKEMNDFIASYADIKETYKMERVHGCMNDMDYMIHVNSKPEYYNVLEGRTCLYDNEAVVTEFVAEELGVDIGDEVEVKYKEETHSFIISGIYQCANDVGANFGISIEGFARFKEVKDDSFFTYYIFEDGGKRKGLGEIIKERYGEEITLSERTWSGTEGILMAMDAIEILMYVVTVVFIMVAIVMTGSKVLYREQRDLAIYKALGFTSGKLRVTFGLRFLMVAAIGGVVGIGVSAFATDSLMEMALRFCGVSKFESYLPVLQTILPATIVAGLFMLFAYVAAGKIKKVEPGKLMDMS